MEIKAKAKYIKMSPKKVRLVIDVIRGMDVKNALDQLRFLNKAATKPIEKLLNSAIANAVHNFSLEKNNLYIKEIRADEGPTLKRWRPRAFGRAGAIRKRSSHISIILDELVKSKTKHEGKKEKLTKPKIIKGMAHEVAEKGKLKPKKENKQRTQEPIKEIFDEREKGKHRHKEHLDNLREKDKGGFAKKIFRRKAG